MDDFHKHLPHLYLFQNVVRLGSFQAVASKYDLPRSSVSKKIQQLEDKVGQRLINRSTRKLSLTEAGSDLIAASESLNQLVENAQRVIDDHEPMPSGKVKISCSSLLGEYFVLPLIHDLHKTYPEITLELCLSDAYVDLIDQEVDIAIRIGHLPDSSLVARKVGDKRSAWFASPEYLKKVGEPNSPETLNEHQCLIFKNKNITLNHWPFMQVNGDIKKIKITNSLAADEGRALVTMARLGLGIIMIDPLLIKHDIETKKLVPVLTDWLHPDVQPINLVCLGRKNLSRASNVIWEVLSKHLQDSFNQ